MLLDVTPSGDVRCLYDESINLAAVGQLTIRRGSHVEPAAGGWTADMSPVDGPVLGPFPTRSEALRAEVAWLEENWL